MTSTCTTLLSQLRTQWDYTTAGVLADAFAENDDSLSAALWYVLAEPHSDERRLEFAAECEREVEKKCACKNGHVYVHGIWERGNWRGGKTRCARCLGTGTIREPRDAARAEFIEVQIELERFKEFRPEHRKEFNEAARVKLDKQASRLERGESESIKIARAVEEGRRMYDKRRDDLRHRERELLGPIPSPNVNDIRWGGLLAEIPNCDYDWMRGFISRVLCSAHDWLTHGPAIRLVQPVVEVTLNLTLEERMAFIFGCKVHAINSRDFAVEDYPGIVFSLPGDRPDEDELAPERERANR